ncbi:MAG: hypothetical protein ACT4P6_00905 [Gemmatimonadaceae bacterium]
MSDLQYRPRSITEIIDAAFQIYRQDALRYILITAVAYAPFMVVQFVVIDPANVTVAASMVGLASSVVGFFAFTIMSAVLVRLSAEAYLGRDMEISTALAEVIPRVPSILAASVIRLILIFIAALALIIPAFWMSARTFALTPLIVLERADVATALNRSALLSKDRKLAIIGCYALALLIFYVLTLAFGFVGAIVGGGVLYTVINAIATVVIYPVIGIMEMVLYYDARIRAEGYDVELMANALGASAS